MSKIIRILLTKAGCDIHERGVLTLLNVFKDAGMEVIYTGRYQSPEAIANAAITEDVDIIAISDQTGSLPIIFRDVIAELKAKNATDIKLMAGGLLSAEDVVDLEKMGVTGNYGPGTDTDEIVNHVRKIMGN